VGCLEGSWGGKEDEVMSRGTRKFEGRDIRGDALWSGAEMLDEDATLAKGFLVNCLAVGQALAEGLLDTGTMGA